MCYGNKQNPWWNDETQFLHEKRMVIVKKLKKTDYDKNELKIIKNRLHAIKKKYKKNHRLNLNRQLMIENRINKLKFWRILNYSLTKKVEPNIHIDKIRKEFENLFNQKLLSDEGKERQAKLDLDNLINNNQNAPRIDVEVDIDTIYSIINGMSNGKMAGHCGVSADMIKSLSFKYKINPDDLVHEYSPMVKIIYNLIKIIIHKNVFPTNFNISIIIPLLKDLTKSKSDITNIRPISISNYLANIYEKFILKKIDARYAQSKKQFGFSRNCSCSHAVYVLLEKLKYISK